VKREAKVMCGVDEDTDDDVSAARGASGDARAMRGTVVSRTWHRWGTGAMHGMGIEPSCGAGVDIRSTCGVGRDIGTVCGTGWGAGAARGIATVFEVPATEEW
jgi:hypothetical protein